MNAALKVISFFETDRRDHWLAELSRSDWRAAAFLCALIREDRFFETFGDRSRLLLLADGDELVSFCTFAERDDIPDTDLTPWIGFVFTFPKLRGHRCAGLLFDEVERLAREEGIPAVYLSTNHVGLYEKYGFIYKTELADMDGSPSRIYELQITERSGSCQN